MNESTRLTRLVFVPRPSLLRALLRAFGARWSVLTIFVVRPPSSQNTSAILILLRVVGFERCARTRSAAAAPSAAALRRVVSRRQSRSLDRVPCELPKRHQLIIQKFHYFFKPLDCTGHVQRLHRTHRANSPTRLRPAADTHPQISATIYMFGVNQSTIRVAGPVSSLVYQKVLRLAKDLGSETGTIMSRVSGDTMKVAMLVNVHLILFAIVSIVLNFGSLYSVLGVWALPGVGVLLAASPATAWIAKCASSSECCT